MTPAALRGMPMNSETAGLRRSKSASTTREPRRASAAARFAAVVVFPSPFSALVTAR